jgi:hypothetical protein
VGETALDAECRRCDGEGEYLTTWGGGPDDAGYVQCEDCEGSGWISCERGGVGCPFKYCYCEAAWERQEESKMGDG